MLAIAVPPCLHPLRHQGVVTREGPRYDIFAHDDIHDYVLIQPELLEQILGDGRLTYLVIILVDVARLVAFAGAQGPLAKHRGGTVGIDGEDMAGLQQPAPDEHQHENRGQTSPKGVTLQIFIKICVI